MDEKKSKRTWNLQCDSCLPLLRLQKHHVYWPGNMSCCVKSSFLRRLAEQKGQKSMLIKGCGQLLAHGFALIKAKCSCSQKTLLIYSSNSEHWLWVKPVGFVSLRALTKKSHFLQRYEVCVCFALHVFVYTGCPCGQFMLWAFLPGLSGTCGMKLVMVLSHCCCALHSPWVSLWVTRVIPYLTDNSFI